MSYILDALRRADSERERGAVPSIHSPPVPPVVDDPQPSGRQPQRLLVGVIVVLLLALVGLLAWHWVGDQGARPQSTAAPTAVVAEALPQTPPPPPQPVQAPTAAMPEAPLPVAPPAPAAVERPSPAPVVPTRPSAGAPVFTTAPPVVTVPARPAPVPRTAAPSAVPAAVPAVSQADTRVYAVHDLPADIQRELPKLVVGGAMYSDTPANRMLIINSQVFHEGDKLGPDLLLQEIKLKSAVFQYKGYRYGVSY